MPDIEEVEEDGVTLFNILLLEEAQRHSGMSVNQLVEALGIPMRHNNSALPPNIRQCVKVLTNRIIQKEREGNQMQTQATSDNLDNIDEFRQRLTVFFREFNRERLIELFLFCAHALLKAFNENKVQLCKDMFLWTIDFIKTKVSPWVAIKGGWGKVLGIVYEVAYRTLTIITLSAVAIAALVYIFRNK